MIRINTLMKIARNSLILLGLIACTPNISPPSAPTPITIPPSSVPPTTLPIATVAITSTTSETPKMTYEPIIGLQLIAQGFSAPVALVPDGLQGGMRYIVDQTGLIWSITPQGEVLSQPFLDLRTKMVKLNQAYDERGLLGLAFHPNFQDNRRFFVYYSAPRRADAPTSPDHTSHISEFKVSGVNPVVADLDSERILLQVDQPQSNHNAGQLAFDPDGYLYIALGDGGAANDSGLGHTPNLGNGQDSSNLLGSILRIDVNGDIPYAIPPNNPFNGSNGKEEIFAYGFRNPYRFSFDAGGTHQLFVADVGQNRWEEVNIVSIGNNYGWNIKEGSHCFDPQNPNQAPPTCPSSGQFGEPLVDPIIEYLNANAPGGNGISVIGGFVYRGTALPQFQGRYIFGDWSTSFNRSDGTLFVATTPSADGTQWTFEELRLRGMNNERLGSYLIAFGQDADLELYVLTTKSLGPIGDTGKVWKIVNPISAAE